MYKNLFFLPLETKVRSLIICTTIDWSKTVTRTAKMGGLAKPWLNRGGGGIVVQHAVNAAATVTITTAITTATVDAALPTMIYGGGISYPPPSSSEVAVETTATF